ncbi:unnamed protein product [Dimorphilus gyrociliatus]|uniref:Uncharacterized protein n=1 Tax=Dimorphilus gyrociliatus TaxID=2664684 RepID=A0A7I8VDV2_9ANNE|nr:unnamed protein product [Dimorphilus gyrociliatus]
MSTETNITNSTLHYTIIKTVIDKGYAPDLSKLSEILGQSEDQIKAALYKLQNDHGVVLHPNEPKVWVIHPFSLAPTNFYVKSEKGEWWGNCAWCSLGIAAILKENVTIATNIGGEDKHIIIEIVDGELKNKGLFIHFPIPMKEAWKNVIFTCGVMLAFESEDEVDVWSKKHNIPKGDVQPIEKIWNFAKKWYGNHANPKWNKWTIDEAKSMFSEFQLNHPIWNLENSEKNF